MVNDRSEVAGLLTVGSSRTALLFCLLAFFFLFPHHFIRHHPLLAIESITDRLLLLRFSLG